MKVLKVFKGHHYCYSDLPRFLRWGKSSELITRTIKFTKDSEYDTGSDQTDVNKLFGLSVGYHHKNSVRIGYRNISADTFEVVLYKYIDGVRIKTTLCRVSSFDEVKVTMCLFNLEDTIHVRTYVETYHRVGYHSYSDITFFRDTFFNRLSYTLGFYFGGNRTAPKDVSINVIK